jgi:hypothetical protein
MLSLTGEGRLSKSRDRRRALRVPANNLISYSAQRADRLYKMLGMAVTLDLSESGIRVRTLEPLPLGEELTFTLKLENAVHPVKGRIVWGAEVEEGKSYEFGVRFKDLEFNLARDLWKVTEKLLAETPAESHAVSIEKSGVLPFLTATARRGKSSADPELVLTLESAPPRPEMPERIEAPAPALGGRFEGAQLLDFVKTVGAGNQTGVVEVTVGENHHYVAIREGRVIAARTHDDRAGPDAVHEILGAKEGQFEFWPHTLREVRAEHTLEIEPLLAEVKRRRDATGS